MSQPAIRNVPNWSHLLLAGVLVALVGGAYWIKTRPRLAIAVAPEQDSTEALLARGVSLHHAQQYETALAAYYRRILQRDPAHSQAHHMVAQVPTRELPTRGEKIVLVRLKSL